MNFSMKRTTRSSPSFCQGVNSNCVRPLSSWNSRVRISGCGWARTRNVPSFALSTMKANPSLPIGLELRNRETALMSMSTVVTPMNCRFLS
ncbi:MAG: hypothetical protein A4E67_01194 [Syntrophaceae bacterium PtaB.Bin038]|nr:MAG: hypothetical protein A4E67_01194 [Syntrophaceae bacterium PtaB.Bin038]